MTLCGDLCVREMGVTPVSEGCFGGLHELRAAHSCLLLWLLSMFFPFSNTLNIQISGFCCLRFSHPWEGFSYPDLCQPHTRTLPDSKEICRLLQNRGSPVELTVVTCTTGVVVVGEAAISQGEGADLSFVTFHFGWTIGICAHREGGLTRRL